MMPKAVQSCESKVQTLRQVVTSVGTTFAAKMICEVNAGGFMFYSTLYFFNFS